jgi:transposase-like protein
MPQAVTIRGLPRASEFVKAMQAQGLERGEGYRGLGRAAIAAILQGQMGQTIDQHLARMASRDEADRRNGFYPRHLLTELGDIELLVPRTRRFAPIAVVRAYARRPEQVDRMILSCFVLGLSVRKVSEALRPILGRPISPATVSTVAKQLDAVVAVFHARPLKERYRVLMLDGVVLARKTGPTGQSPWHEGPRRHQTTGSGRSRAAARRQKGDHRLPPGAKRKRRRMGTLSRRPDPPRPDR